MKSSFSELRSFLRKSFFRSLANPFDGHRGQHIHPQGVSVSSLVLKMWILLKEGFFLHTQIIRPMTPNIQGVPSTIWESMKMMHFSGRSALLLVAIPLFVAGCSGFKVWPFGDSEAPRTSRGLENATEYRCDAGKVFHVRYLDAGKSTWLILPERQVRLDRVAGDSGTRYSNGIAELRVSGDEAVLTDGPAISYSGCKSGIPVKP